MEYIIIHNYKKKKILYFVISKNVNNNYESKNIIR